MLAVLLGAIGLTTLFWIAVTRVTDIMGEIAAASGEQSAYPAVSVQPLRELRFSRYALESPFP